MPLIDTYGADTVRIYTLFIGPPEKDAEWNDRAMEGAYRFVNRVWRLYANHREILEGIDGEESVDPEGLDQDHLKLYRAVQITIERVTGDIFMRGFQFNTAISGLMELTNEMYLFIEQNESFKRRDAGSVKLFRESLRNLLLLLAPIAPHLCEEIWERMGHETTIFSRKLPRADAKHLKAETYTLVVQVNGKVRARIEAEKDAAREKLSEMALGDEKVQRFIGSGKIVKVIVIPGSLVNIVVRDD
jgi:leucyl-tRNA synthetase